MNLEVNKRPDGIKANAVRRSGKIPAVYYGQGKKTLELEVGSRQFKKVFDKAGENTIIELLFEGAKVPVLVHDVQFDPVSDSVAHIDFIHVDMQKEVTTTVKVVIVGVAPAVKNLGGILAVSKHELKIKCLPKDLIHSVEVDVSPIVDYRTSIHVKDVKVPPTIKILDNLDDTVVTATPPKAEEEAKPEVAAAVTPEAAAAGAPPAAPGAATPAAPAAAKPAKEGKK